MPTMLRCERCGHENSSEAFLCVKCGEMLNRPTSPLPTDLLKGISPRPSFGSAMLDPDFKLMLHIGESSILLPFPHECELMLGRTVHKATDTILDPSEMLISSSSNAPVILENPLTFMNLEPYKALAGGVSRKHARIQHEGYVLTLQDLNSTNGTFVNGERLRSGEKRIIRDNDVLLLGTLRITIRFQQTSLPDLLS
jgi:hypothetical protein